MITFVCACNNREVCNNMLIKSLKAQNNQNYELIIVDAQKENFTSASETLNYGFSKAKGEYVAFVHQDVELIGNDFVDLLIRYCHENDFGIAGVAGATGTDKFSVFSSVLMGIDRRQAGEKLNCVCECFALDEVLLIVKKDTFVGFNNYGNTWHFYGVEYSYRCHKNGDKVLLFPIPLYHASDAKSLNFSYFDTLLLYAKQNKDIKLIRTCCGYFKNNCLLPFYCFYRKTKLLLKRLLKI